MGFPINRPGRSPEQDLGSFQNAAERAGNRGHVKVEETSEGLVVRPGSRRGLRDLLWVQLGRAAGSGSRTKETNYLALSGLKSALREAGREYEDVKTAVRKNVQPDGTARLTGQGVHDIIRDSVHEKANQIRQQEVRAFKAGLVREGYVGDLVNNALQRLDPNVNLGLKDLTDDLKGKVKNRYEIEYFKSQLEDKIPKSVVDSIIFANSSEVYRGEARITEELKNTVLERSRDLKELVDRTFSVGRTVTYDAIRQDEVLWRHIGAFARSERGGENYSFLAEMELILDTGNNQTLDANWDRIISKYFTEDSDYYLNLNGADRRAVLEEQPSKRESLEHARRCITNLLINDEVPRFFSEIRKTKLDD